MIDPSKLIDSVRSDCDEFKSDNPGAHEYEHMDAVACFEQYLEWNGIIGYTERIVAALDSCRMAESEMPVNDDEYRLAIRIVARHEIQKVIEFYRRERERSLSKDAILNLAKVGMEDGLVEEVLEVVKEVLDGK